MSSSFTIHWPDIILVKYCDCFHEGLHLWWVLSRLFCGAHSWCKMHRRSNQTCDDKGPHISRPKSYSSKYWWVLSLPATDQSKDKLLEVLVQRNFCPQLIEHHVFKLFNTFVWSVCIVHVGDVTTPWWWKQWIWRTGW